MQHKVGIYCRVSTEEQAQVLEGSLESQKHRLVGYVEAKNTLDPHWGKIIDYYVDEGFSAKDTRRPALQRLLKDLRAGKVNLILVTDLSRLSRNILDFCLLLEDLKKYNGKFLSIKEQFDTTTAAGEMMVFNMINLAQFERKQTAERVSQNFHSRALRGLLNGGPVILGYDKNPDNPSQYVVNESEAPIVREIFRIFLEVGTLRKTAKKLNELSIPRKKGLERNFRLADGGLWNYQAVTNLVTNKAYIGIREVNKKYKNKDPFSLKPWQQPRESKASWPAIIDANIFENAQRVISSAKNLERPKTYHSKGSPFILTGLLKCGECGAPFIGETGHGRNEDYRYYGHKQYEGISFKCSVRRFNSEVAEDAIQKLLERIALNPKEFDLIELSLKETHELKLSDDRSEKERILKRLSEIEKESKSVFRILSEMDSDASLKMVKEKLDTLGSEKLKLETGLKALEEKLEMDRNIREACRSLENRVLEFKGGWKKGSLAEKKRLLRAVIDRIEVNLGFLGVHYLVPEIIADRDQGITLLKPKGSDSKEFGKTEEVKIKKAAGNSVFPAAFGSSIDKIGVTDGA